MRNKEQSTVQSTVQSTEQSTEQLTVQSTEQPKIQSTVQSNVYGVSILAVLGIGLCVLFIYNKGKDKSHNLLNQNDVYPLNLMMTLYNK